MQDRLYNSLKSESNVSEIQRPTFCCVGISTMCILRCKMCCVWKGNYVKSHSEPILQEWYNFFNRIGDFTDNKIEINFAGGEPLLDDRNLALIIFCAKRGLFTSMVTNGFLADKEAAYKIADSGLNLIGISLDGINKNTHDFLRGTEGCFDKVMRAISYLDRYRSDLKIEVMTIILEKNLDEIVKLAEWVNKDERIYKITFQALAQPFNTPFDNEWYKRSEYNLLWPKDINKVNDTLNELIELKEMGYKITNPISQLRIFKRYFERPQDFIKKTSCNVDFYMNIDQFGNVYMCTFKESVGNIKTDNPKDMWYSEEANQRREEIKNCRANCHHLINCCYEEE